MIQLKNSNNVLVNLLAHGARIQGIQVPDKNGNFSDVVLGYDTEQEYIENHIYHGAICGRFGNRIRGASFKIGDETYKLTANDGKNCLHGGSLGLSGVTWDIVSHAKDSATFSYLSPHGQEGFPGNVEFTVKYTLSSSNELVIDLVATTDKTTPINLTSHPYFNLSGEGNGNVLDHIMQASANSIVEINQEAIPTGNLKPVENSAFDFRNAKPFRAHINAQDQQLVFGNGYDHTFVTSETIGTLHLQAKVTDRSSGRTLEVFSTYPGVQLYTANWLNEKGKESKQYQPRTAFCLEPQFFPDSPNQASFPFEFLQPGQEYKHQIIYKFSVEGNL